MSINTTGTTEEYLEAIINMIAEGKKVLGARLAERLEVSPPTVTATLNRMKRDGLIEPNRKDGVSLTPRGRELAAGIVRRHRLAERLLTDILHIPWSETHQEACLLEHAISEKVVERLDDVLGRPQTCPHGNPIPRDGRLPAIRGVPLDAAEKGEVVTVERISEEANRSPELMKYFEEKGIIPGTALTVEDVAEYAGMLTVSVGGTSFSMGTKAAALVWVTPTGG